MKLAGPIQIRVSSRTPADLSGLIVVLKVSAGRKNPFYICSPKTDESGAATITVDDFIGQFEDHFEQGLMDYDGSVGSANPVVAVSLLDPTWSRENRRLALAWPLSKNERRKWTSREEEYQHRMSCRNPLFDFSAVFVDLDKARDVRLVIWPRSQVAG